MWTGGGAGGVLGGPHMGGWGRSPGTGWQRVDGPSQGWRETPLESRSRLVGALGPTVAPKGGRGGRRGEGQKLLTTTPLLLPMSTLGRVWGEI